MILRRSIVSIPLPDSYKRYTVFIYSIDRLYLDYLLMIMGKYTVMVKASMVKVAMAWQDHAYGCVEFLLG